jgi:hypothetical protein
LILSHSDVTLESLISIMDNHYKKNKKQKKAGVAVPSASSIPNEYKSVWTSVTPTVNHHLASMV